MVHSWNTEGYNIYPTNPFGGIADQGALAH